MAPVYTARHVSAADKTTPLFSLKGLQNLAPLPISQCGISGIPLERQVAYTQYAANIGSFVHASIKRVTTIVSDVPKGMLPLNRSLPLTPPPVSLSLQKEINHESSEKFVRMLGAGATQQKVGKTTIYSAPSITNDVLNKIIPVASTHFNAGRDAVNPMGLKVYNFISSAFAEILRVHSYSAFLDESDYSLTEMKTLLDKDKTAYYTFKKKGTDDRSIGSRYLTNLPPVIDTAETGMDVEAPEDPRKALLEKSEGYVNTDGTDTVLYARPPKSPVVNFGSSNAVPELPGILFPYFHGLSQPDHQSLMSFTIKHLFQLLGSTVQECQDTYASFRRGFNSLATTNAGMELAHIGFGIDLAIQTQGRCFIIIESNKYMGFTLLGARLAVFDSNKWIAAYDAKSLRDDLSVIDPHRAAVRRLVDMFSELGNDGAYTGPTVTEDTFSEPKDLISVFKGLKLDELEDVEKELNRNVRSLNYMGEGYLQRNPQVLTEVLTTLFSDATIEVGRPTYIPSVRAPLESREFIVLSKFGPEAPSLWNERGQDYPCVAKESIQSGATKRKLGELDVYANLPSRLLVTPKPLEIAVKDMVRVADRGAVRMDLKERAGKNRNMSVESELMRKQIWKVLVEGLKDSVSKRRKVETAKQGANATENFDDLMSGLLE